jgi:hypothetical protein
VQRTGRWSRTLRASGRGEGESSERRREHGDVAKITERANHGTPPGIEEGRSVEIIHERRPGEVEDPHRSAAGGRKKLSKSGAERVDSF